MDVRRGGSIAGNGAGTTTGDHLLETASAATLSNGVTRRQTDLASARRRRSGWAIAVLYLAAVAAAEVGAARFGAGWGLVGHVLLLIALLIAAARLVFAPAAADGPIAPTAGIALAELIALTLPPVIRIAVLALPLAEFDQGGRHAAVAAPTLVAAVVAMRAAGYQGRDVGLRVRWGWRGLPLDLLVGVAGVGLGYAAYLRLDPIPLVEVAPGAARAVVALAVPLAVAAIVEELVFRGVLQRAATDALGVVPGVLFVALLSALLATGAGGTVDVAAAFGIALFLGVAARLTGSLLGASLARAVAAIFALVLFPSLL